MPDQTRGEQSIPLSIELDRADEMPLYRQIVDQIWTQVIDGSINGGALLPTVRHLAIDLGVHPDTIARAYSELELLGVVHARRGEGTFVGLRPPNRAELERRRRLEQICIEAVAEAKRAGYTTSDVIEILKEIRKSP